MPEIGDRIPQLAFTLSTGATASFADYSDKWLVLYFYPKDSTPGCTLEGNDFNALLPKFKRHGATVHFVVPEMDSGPVIAQGALGVRDDDTAETLAARVLAIEHKIYPLALRLVAEGRVRIENGRCRIDGARNSDTVLLIPDADG